MTRQEADSRGQSHQELSAGSRITRAVSPRTLGRKQNHADNLTRKLFSRTVAFEGSKGLPSEAKYQGQSRQKVKTGGQVYNLCENAQWKLTIPNAARLFLLLHCCCTSTVNILGHVGTVS